MSVGSELGVSANRQLDCENATNFQQDIRSGWEQSVSASKVTCPGCSTTLQLPAGFTAGKIKCPKCAKILVLKGPTQTAATQPTAPQSPAITNPPASNQAGGGSAFASLPSFGSQTSTGQPGLGLPPAQAAPARSQFPSTATPAYRQQPGGGPHRAPKTKKKKKSGGGSPVKILLIVGGIVAGLGVLGCAGLIAVAVSRAGTHSGWTTMNEQGVEFKFPPGRVKTTPTQNMPGATGTRLNAVRLESGSLYGFETFTFKVPPPPGMRVEELMTWEGSKVTDPRAVWRGGVRGYHYTVISATGIPPGTELEVFLRNNKIYSLTYSAYSKAKASTTSTKTPRENEQELDKPEEFFESLRFK